MQTSQCIEARQEAVAVASGHPQVPALQARNPQPQEYQAESWIKVLQATWGGGLGSLLLHLDTQLHHAIVDLWIKYVRTAEAQD